MGYHAVMEVGKDDFCILHVMSRVRAIRKDLFIVSSGVERNCPPGVVRCISDRIKGAVPLIVPRELYSKHERIYYIWVMP